MSKNASVKGMGLGVMGGLIGTIVMDLVIVGLFRVVGMPMELIYSFIGSVADSFFLKVGWDSQGGIPLGATIHFLLGLGLGGIFGMAVTEIKLLQVDTLKKGILFGVIYIEIASQPILVTAPLLVKMTSADLVQWYVLSFAMHLIYGIVLGGIVTHRSWFTIPHRRETPEAERRHRTL